MQHHLLARARWPLAALAVAIACGLWAQQPGTPEVRLRSTPYVLPPLLITANSNVVSIEATVRDRSGVAIPALTRDRFRVLDNGKAQALTLFRTATAESLGDSDTRPEAAGVTPSSSPPPPGAVPSAQPRFVSLLFDDINSDKNALAEARNAAVRFAHESFGPADRFAVFTTSNTVSLGFTANQAALAAALARMAPHPRANARGYGTCPRITSFQAYLIMEIHDPVATRAAETEAQMCSTGDFDPRVPLVNNLWSDSDPVHMQAEATWEMARQSSQATQAAVKDVVDFTGRQPGKRIVVLASGGFLSGSLEDQQDAIIRDAIRADVVIDSLDAKGLFTDGPGRPLDENNGLGTLPLATYFFEENSKLSRQFEMNSAMANLAVSTGGLFFHNNNDLTLGFERLGLAPAISYELAFAPQHVVHDGKLHQLRVELVPPISGATIEARRGYMAPPPGPIAADLERQLDQAMRGTDRLDQAAAKLAVRSRPGEIAVQITVPVARHDQRWKMLAGLFTSSGSFVTGQQGEIELALKKETLRRLERQGLSPSFVLRAPPGTYRLRVVVQDRSSDQISAFSQPVQIR